MITALQIIGTILFGVAVLHTFFVGVFIKISHRYPKHSFLHGFFHLMGEIEVVFAVWAAVLMGLYIGIEGWDQAIEYQKSLNFTEPFFIFAIMVICSTRPILTGARQLILAISSCLQKVLRTPAIATDVFVVLTLGPLSGSLITEPAAMTVTAFMLNSILEKESDKLLYAALAVLFVNVSIGGALTPFAAPPILMVAHKWNWDFNYVFFNLGWKSAIAVFVNTLGLIFIFKSSLQKGVSLKEVETRMSGSQAAIPFGVTFLHLIFLVGVVLTSHYQNAFLGIFLLFLGVASVTQSYQDSLRLKESLLVSLFLGGIIQFGAFQEWWLSPLLSSLNEFSLFVGAVSLTAVTDNAALTYLGSQVTSLSDASKYSLVAGAIVGGGLTVIANAPNAAGYSILSHRFKSGLSPLRLLLSAMAPTAVAFFCLWVL